MPDPKEAPNQTSLALAALIAGLARTLCESDQSFGKRLDHHMDQVYNQVKNSPLSSEGALETMRFFRDLWRET